MTVRGGPAELIATDNGSPCDMTSFVSPERQAFNGLFMAIVRSVKGQTGTITVTARSGSLKTAEVEIRSK